MYPKAPDPIISAPPVDAAWPPFVVLEGVEVVGLKVALLVISESAVVVGADDVAVIEAVVNEVNHKSSDRRLE